jgi:hypothetical protein
MEVCGGCRLLAAQCGLLLAETQACILTTQLSPVKNRCLVIEAPFGLKAIRPLGPMDESIRTYGTAVEGQIVVYIYRLYST